MADRGKKKKTSPAARDHNRMKAEAKTENNCVWKRRSKTELWKQAINSTGNKKMKNIDNEDKSTRQSNKPRWHFLYEVNELRERFNSQLVAN